MDALQRDGVEQVLFELFAVVHVEEFAGDEPEAERAGSHPGVREQHEVAIQSGEPRQTHARSGLRGIAQPCFGFARQVMVTDVGRVTDDQVEAVAVGNRRLRGGEIGVVDGEAVVVPESEIAWFTCVGSISKPTARLMRSVPSCSRIAA